MKVFLSGYGKMGRMLEELALERGWDIVGHADITCPEAYETAPGADVCLDFSGVGALQPLLGYLHRTKTALVSGTTGLTEPDLDALHELAASCPSSGRRTTARASPCSAGCCMTMRASLLAGTRRSWKSTTTRRPTRRAARQSSCCRSWTQRARRRSFTAARASGGKRKPEEIGVFSLRGGTVAGEHTVYFFGEDETLQITHRAASRRIFAAGALRAAQAISGRGPGFYTLDELLFEI